MKDPNEPVLNYYDWDPNLDFRPCGKIRFGHRIIEKIWPLRYCDHPEDEEYQSYTHCFVDLKEEQKSKFNTIQAVAFGDCARALQKIDYINNEVSMGTFVADNGQTVIFEFHEYPGYPTHTFNGKVGSKTMTVSEFRIPFKSMFYYANYEERGMFNPDTVYFYGLKERQRKLDKLTYASVDAAEPHKARELIKMFLSLKDNERLLMARVTTSGYFYRSYQWYCVYPNDTSTLSELLDIGKSIVFETNDREEYMP